MSTCSTTNINCQSSRADNSQYIQIKASYYTITAVVQHIKTQWIYTHIIVVTANHFTIRHLMTYTVCRFIRIHRHIQYIWWMTSTKVWWWRFRLRYDSTTTCYSKLTQSTVNGIIDKELYLLNRTNMQWQFDWKFVMDKQLEILAKCSIAIVHYICL